jgi:hypothetical protein
MADVELDTKQLEEFSKSLLGVCDIYLDTAEKHLKTAGNKLKKAAKENSPDSGAEHKKKLNKSWKSEIEGYNASDLQYKLWSSAPHYHLVERGHAMVTKDGKTVGFVQGTHFFDKTVKEFEASGEAAKEIEKLAKDLADKVGKR